jgi:hypothetical protein
MGHVIVNDIWDGKGVSAIGEVQASPTAYTVLDRLKSITTALTPSGATPTDRSGTITTGGSAQVLAAAHATRRWLFIQNTSTGILYFSFTGTASLSSVQLAPGACYENPSHFCPVGAISIYGATTAQAFVAMEA